MVVSFPFSMVQQLFIIHNWNLSLSFPHVMLACFGMAIYLCQHKRIYIHYSAFMAFGYNRNPILTTYPVE